MVFWLVVIIMKNIKNKTLTRLFVLFTITFAINTFSMRMSETGKTLAKSSLMKMQQKKQLTQQLHQEREKQYQEGKIFIYENDTSKGILVDKDFLKQNCKSIAFLLEDLGEFAREQKEIPLSYPFETIQLAFGILHNNIDINTLSLEQLLNATDLLNFLDVPPIILKNVITNITAHVDKNNKNIIHNETLKELNRDLQEQIIITPTINYLKNF